MWNLFHAFVVGAVKLDYAKKYSNRFARTLHT